MNGINRENLTALWQKAAQEEEEPVLIASPKDRTPRKEAQPDIRRMIAGVFKELGIRPGDKLLVRRGEETKEINVDSLFEAQP